MVQRNVHIAEQEDIEDFDVAMTACENHGIKRGKFVADAVREYFLSGKWDKIFVEAIAMREKKRVDNG